MNISTKLFSRVVAGQALKSELTNMKSALTTPATGPMSIYSQSNEKPKMDMLTDSPALQSLQDRIDTFQRSRFPGQSLRAKLTKLLRETEELIASDDNDLQEWADVFIVLLGAAALEGIDARSLITLAHMKMDINDKREWHDPDAQGLYQHKD